MTSPWTAPLALALAAVAGGATAMITLPKPLSPEESVGCRTIVWVMQRAGYQRDDQGNVIPIDHRPDLTARGDAIGAALAAETLRLSPEAIAARQAFEATRSADRTWERMEASAYGPGGVEPLAADCERKLGLRL